MSDPRVHPAVDLIFQDSVGPSGTQKPLFPGEEGLPKGVTIPGGNNMQKINFEDSRF